jgi:hypothetical protein
MVQVYLFAGATAVVVRAINEFCYWLPSSACAERVDWLTPEQAVVTIRAESPAPLLWDRLKDTYEKAKRQAGIDA